MTYCVPGVYRTVVGKKIRAQTKLLHGKPGGRAMLTFYGSLIRTTGTYWYLYEILSVYSIRPDLEVRKLLEYK